VELPLSPRDMLLKQLANRTGSLNGWTASASAALSVLLGPVRDAAQELANLQDPRHLYVRCLGCGMVR
jgi:protease-4